MLVVVVVDVDDVSASVDVSGTVDVAKVVVAGAEVVSSAVVVVVVVLLLDVVSSSAVDEAGTEDVSKTVDVAKEVVSKLVVSGDRVVVGTISQPQRGQPLRSTSMYSRAPGLQLQERTVGQGRVCGVVDVDSASLVVGEAAVVVGGAALVAVVGGAPEVDLGTQRHVLQPFSS